MAKVIEGSIEKVFVIINTTNYNNDGKYAVTTCKLSELPSLGFNDVESMEKCNNMKVDELGFTDYEGCYVMRIA